MLLTKLVEMLNLARMKLTSFRIFCFCVMGLFFGLPLHAQFQGQEFVQNKGQWPSDVQFLAKEGAAKIWMGTDRFLYQLNDFSTLEKAHHEHLLLDNPTIASNLIEQRFIGMNPSTSISGQEPRPYTYNFFLGKDQNKWASEVSAFKEVNYENYYPGIHLNWQNESGHYK